MLRSLLKNPAPPSIEQRSALLAGKHVTYTLRRSRKRRSIGLNIDERGLTVSVPMRASEKWLRTVLQEKADWVVAKLDGWMACRPAAIRWRDGEAIDYLGDLLTLRVILGLFDTPAQRYGRELWVFVTDAKESSIEHAVSAWYRREAETHFLLRTAHFAPLLNVTPRSVKLSEAKTQWGCCTERGAIRLHLHLIKLPPRLVDYVVAHELAHLRELNHSTAFWRLVESVCPDYAKLRSELKAVSIG